MVGEGARGGGRLRAGPFERSALDHVDGDVELPERGLDAREVYLAIALRGMRIARPQQRALYEHRQIKRRPGGQLTQVQIAPVASRRGGGVPSGLGAPDTEDFRKKPQRKQKTRQ